MKTNYKTSICAVIFSLVWSSSSTATEKDDLIANIVTGGTHEFEDERHTVEVSNCTMTTYRWKNHETAGWTLWSSFKFAMNEGHFTKDGNAPNERYFISVISANVAVEHDTAEFASWIFYIHAPEVASFERSNLRPQEEGDRISSRNNGTTHHIREEDRAIVMLEGPEVNAKAKLFTESFRQYVAKYCTFLG